MTRRWPPRDYPGLYVDCGDKRRGVWLRLPYAELRCRVGCEHQAEGPAAVVRFLEDLGDLTHFSTDRSGGL
ncbi:hypothetical protein [Streptomyces albipurpureus]|uniref:Uncharacterized protein n=1 Tax=Streptomyces albipurpureus TaxID=2897419 RepID=A0ABT0UNZ8_9ACTN|nr:hypothetical protein [Streptomyces sp. CWNU-1]MCM2390165.1 hypothetical protein [Streptomyces sp. CWNU-1]